MLKAIIVDDEAKARRILESFIKEYCSTIQICALAEDVPTAVKAIKKFEPDLVFLDIEMPGYNGFQLLEFFDDVNFEIIFVTAYSEFAIKAFQVSAIDYLLKPLQIEQLIHAVEKVEKLKGNSLIKQKLEALQTNLKENKIQKIAVPVSNGTLFVDVKDITHLKAEGSYVNIFLKDGNKILVSKNIKDYEDVLTVTEGFFRCHRSFLVNKQFIKVISPDNSAATMLNTHCVQISRERKNDFLQFVKG
jgi:two-component system, LytTR family, response regulator